MNELLRESVFVLCDLMRFFCYKIVHVVAYQITGMLSFALYCPREVAQKYTESL